MAFSSEVRGVSAYYYDGGVFVELPGMAIRKAPVTVHCLSYAAVQIVKVAVETVKGYRAFSAKAKCKVVTVYLVYSKNKVVLFYTRDVAENSACV